MRRGFAILSLVVLGLGQLFGFDHLATARHARCSEHGELVDAGSAPTPGRAAGIMPVSAAAGDHDHCAFAAFLHQAAADTTGPAVLSAAPAPPPPLVALPAPPAPRALVYRLAPKTSPPA